MLSHPLEHGLNMLIVTFAVAIVSGAAIGAFGLAIVTAYKHKDQIRRLHNAAEFARAIESVRQQMCRQIGLPDTSGWSDISCRLSRLQAMVLSRGLSAYTQVSEYLTN